MANEKKSPKNSSKTVYHQEDEKTGAWSQDKNGNKTYYEADGTTIARTVGANGVEVDYSEFRPKWQEMKAQRTVADTKIHNAQDPSTGDSDNPFNKRVDEKYLAKAQSTDRQRPAGRPSSTRVTAKSGVESAAKRRAVEGHRGAVR